MGDSDDSNYLDEGLRVKGIWKLFEPFTHGLKKKICIGAVNRVANLRRDILGPLRLQGAVKASAIAQQANIVPTLQIDVVPGHQRE